MPRLLNIHEMHCRRQSVTICRSLGSVPEKATFELGIEGFVGFFQEVKNDNGTNQQKENLYKDKDKCKGTVHLGKGWRNKNKNGHKVRCFREKNMKDKNGKLHSDKIIKDLLCNPKILDFTLSMMDMIKGF